MSSIFIKKEIYPDAKAAFNFSLKPLESIKGDCLFVLDANVLLLPFTADGKSLDEIKRIYEMLVADNRLFIPAQAAREYLDNRANKLTETHKLVSDRASQQIDYVCPHPLLSGVTEYEELERIENEIRALMKSRKKELNKIKGSVASWGWDDPVSKMYHEVLKGSVLDDKFINAEGIEKDLKRRNDHNIPPGYKDAGKKSNQAGDLLIWHEIINLAKEKGKDVVFVSGDNKADWWHQSDKKGIYPRFELVDEFRKKTDGHSFHILTLSQLLGTYNAPKELVSAIEHSETEVVRASKGFNGNNLEEVLSSSWDSLKEGSLSKFQFMNESDKYFLESLVTLLGYKNVLKMTDNELNNYLYFIVNSVRNEGGKIGLVDGSDVMWHLKKLEVLNNQNILSAYGLTVLNEIAIPF